MTIYTRPHDEHWLRDKQEEGRVMVLDDDSVWEIHPSDRPVAARWLRISTITVKPTQKEDYRYLLTNTTEGEAARANYLDKTMPGRTFHSEVA
jgi:hypothetical protein